MRVGQGINVTVDTYPNATFPGKISTIDPEVDAATRNVAVRATLPNRDRKLLPGMFANARIETGEPVRYITLPYESHRYASKETLEHVAAEFVAWFDRYVKDAAPRTTMASPSFSLSNSGAPGASTSSTPACTSSNGPMLG